MNNINFVIWQWCRKAYWQDEIRTRKLYSDTQIITKTKLYSKYITYSGYMFT